VWQLEKGETGTPHFQIYVELLKPQRMSAMKLWLPGAHFESRKGSAEQARAYCMKEESREEGPWERGDFSIGQGRRTDLHLAVQILKSDGLKRVAEEMPAEYVKYHKGFAALAAELAKPIGDLEFMPRDWQKSLLESLSIPPDDRKIIWVWDIIGNKGKSRLARHLVAEHGAIILSGRVVDMAHAYSSQPIVIFDVARTQAENMNHLYSFAESLKNGVIFSSKYESGQKVFQSPHVVFFSNMPYPSDVWSEDRKEIIKLI